MRLLGFLSLALHSGVYEHPALVRGRLADCLARTAFMGPAGFPCAFRMR